MSLYVEQKYLSGADAFDIVDEYRKPVWRGVGCLSARNGRLDILTSDSVPAAVIERRSGLLSTKFDITISGALFETVRKSSGASVSYELTRSAWNLSGDFLKRSFRITTRHGGVVMTHEKKWFSWGDAYVMDFARREDELMCLCIALAVDCSAEVMNSGSVSVRA